MKIFTAYVLFLGMFYEQDLIATEKSTISPRELKLKKQTNSK